MTSRFSLAVCALAPALLCLPGVAFAQGSSAPGPQRPRGGQGPGPGQANGPQGPTGGLSREEMWYAPTEEDWKKPVLITFQRTYEDAERVSEETGKPILVCINMDGEIASEHYAGIRYRQADIAELYDPYVCVIASVYRHNPRDYDEAGNRVLCPRFGSVTCGEHIRIEPQLFGKFLDDTRVAPRHIMVEDGSEETYDVYYAWDTQSVFETIREGIANRPPAEPTVDRGDQSLVQRVDSRDVQDREAVEQAYRTGDRVLQRELLVRASQPGSQLQVDLLRLALFGDDAELGQVAWRALAETQSIEALPLVRDVLDFELEPEERDAMIVALERLAPQSPKAARLARVHRGLAAVPSTIDEASWRASLALGATPDPYPELPTLYELTEASAQLAAANPTDAGAQLAASAASYDLAFHPDLDPKLRSPLMEDARRLALAGRDLGATGWEVHSLLAATAKALGRPRQGYADAIAAMTGPAPAQPRTWRSKETLSMFAEARQRGLYRAMVRKEEWPAEWLAEADLAFALLAEHPYGTAREVVEHYDYLSALEAKGYATRTLEKSFERFADSPLIHDRLRTRLLKERDLSSLQGLEATYESLLSQSGERTPEQLSGLEWYAGYASMVAAEFHRRSEEREQALAAYDRAVAHFESASSLDPATQESADHYVALAFAGRARLALESGDAVGAVDHLVACFEREPEAANDLDGLGFTPVMTATTVRARLREAGAEDAQAKLAAAIQALDPRLLVAPAFERAAPGTEAAGTRDLRRRRR